MKQSLWILIPLLVFNLSPLLGGGAQMEWMWTGDAGWVQWWTHPWVHVSRYHLLVDSLGFVGLWVMLPKSGWKRFSAWAVTNLGSLTGALLSGAGAVGSFGGLSGVSHGLMAGVAVLGLRSSESPGSRKVHGVLLAAVLGKCLWEVFTGTVFFSGMHLGYVGTPLVGCHLGGALAGVAWVLGMMGLERIPGRRSLCVA